ncbi:DMT family transporter [Marinomonas posidonica]|uniref:DMT family transporter n=1 Tax=Marinomonas posidonica TaxID=936476 RepID=UPI0037355686
MTSLLRLYVGIFLALMAFAANSVLNRLALADGLIDPGSFTLWRLLSGAITLILLCLIHRLVKGRVTLSSMMQEGSWASATALFVYAVGFSYAYITLSTGVGALILFAAVQLTLIGFAIYFGQTLGRLEWFGLVLAFSGFVYLVLPTLTSPSLTGFVLMTLAGVAWGLYTWRGKNSRFPLFATASNFVRTLPMLVILLVLVNLFGVLQSRVDGILLAVLSGAVMSGLGYALWYAVLPLISASMAAVLQLLVPIIATFGGVVFAAENISLHLVSASAIVLGGVLLVILGRKK